MVPQKRKNWKTSKIAAEHVENKLNMSAHWSLKSGTKWRRRSSGEVEHIENSNVSCLPKVEIVEKQRD